MALAVLVAGLTLATASCKGEDEPERGAAEQSESAASPSKVSEPTKGTGATATQEGELNAPAEVGERRVVEVPPRGSAAHGAAGADSPAGQDPETQANGATAAAQNPTKPLTADERRAMIDARREEMQARREEALARRARAEGKEPQPAAVGMDPVAPSDPSVAAPIPTEPTADAPLAPVPIAAPVPTAAAVPGANAPPFLDPAAVGAQLAAPAARTAAAGAPIEPHSAGPPKLQPPGAGAPMGLDEPAEADVQRAAADATTANGATAPPEPVDPAMARAHRVAEARAGADPAVAAPGMAAPGMAAPGVAGTQRAMPSQNRTEREQAAGQVRWAGAPAPSGPPLSIRNAVTKAELERSTGTKLKVAELGGIEPSPGYNSLLFETNGGEFAAAIQVWAESTIKDTRQRYDQMKTTYPNVRDTTNITPYTFFSSWGNQYTMAFMDLKRRRVAAVTCSNQLFRPHQIFQLAKQVHERTMQ